MAKDAKEIAAPSQALAAGRRPAQKRSQVRVGALLDAADALLQDRDISEISLYDVAHAAGVPPTSAYHFFPTKESVFLALAERYLQKMHAALDAPMDLAGVERWQDLVALRYGRVVDYFNANLPARKLFMGTALMSDIKRADFQDMDNSAEGYYRLMDRHFDMPYVRDPAFKFSVTFAIHDGVWATSYAKHGHITPDFAREGLRAALAYMATFLPDTIALRPPGLEPRSSASQPEAEASTKTGGRKSSTGRRPAAG